MEWSKIFELKMLWGHIAPQEPNAFDARVQEAKWEIEYFYKIVDFWQPDSDEDIWDESVRDRQQANNSYDFRHVR